MEANTNAVATIPQYEMFPSIFPEDAGESKGLKINRGEHGTSIVVLKRTGKTDSLSAVTGLSGDALKAREREIRDWAKRQAAPVIAAIMASPEFTYGSMRYGKNGSFSLRMPKVSAKPQPVISDDVLLKKFSSEELADLADKKAAMELAEQEAADAAVNGEQPAAPAAE